MEDDCKDLEYPKSPPDIDAMAKGVALNRLPKKSRAMYEKKYEDLMWWCNAKGVKKVSEKVLLAYFYEKSKAIKSPSLWSTYSMLKATLKSHDNIDIKVYHELTAFLKRESVGYKPKELKVFSQDEIKRFLLEAPDNEFLLKKVILIVGLAGGCGRDELAKMTTESIEDKDSVIIVKSTDSKTNKSRVFLISNDNQDRPVVDYLSLCRTYFKLRPHKATTTRLFLKYNKGVCSNQVVGINNIAKIPKDIAKYLGLPQPADYTGHCFRRTSSNVSGDKDSGSWKNTTPLDDCIEDGNSIENSSREKPLLKELLESSPRSCTDVKPVVLKEPFDRISVDCTDVKPVILTEHLDRFSVDCIDVKPVILTEPLVRSSVDCTDVKPVILTEPLDRFSVDCTNVTPVFPKESLDGFSLGCTNIKPVTLQKSVDNYPHDCTYVTCSHFVEPGDDHERWCGQASTRCKKCSWKGPRADILDHIKSIHSMIDVFYNQKNKKWTYFNTEQQLQDCHPFFVFGMFFWGEITVDSASNSLHIKFYFVPDGKVESDIFVELCMENEKHRDSYRLKLCLDPSLQQVPENNRISVSLLELEKFIAKDNKHLTYEVNFEKIE